MSLLHWKYFFTIPGKGVRGPLKMHVALDEEIISGMPISHNLAKIIF